ncbi:hypothetical protein ABPG72_022394 [Tetrahymena utriculariae]
MEKQNQLSYAVNLEQIRKNSEIPKITNAVSRQQQAYPQNNSVSDDEDYEYHGHSQSNKQDQLQFQQQNQGNSWKVDTIRNTNSFFDNRHIASKQIAQQLSRPIPYSTILLTILAVFISGFKGTAFLMIDLKDPEDESKTGGFILRAFWRQILISIFFIPLIYQEYSKEKTEEIEEMRLYQREHIFNKNCLKTIIFCSFVYAVWVGTMAYSVFHTSIANVYIFNNIYPLFLVIYKMLSYFTPKEEKILRQSINKFETFGALLSITVLVLLVYENTSAVYPELIALVGALSASIYYSNIQQITCEYPWMLAVFLLSTFTTIFFGIYSLIFEKSTFDMNTNHGLFGVFSVDWILLNIFISLVTGVINTKLFSYISQQLKTIYVDIAIMSEAFAAMLLAFIFGFQDFPNLTQLGIYFFYVVALVMLAKGKSEAQIEQISLQDENNIKVNPNIVNGYSNPNTSNRNIGLVSNSRGSYLPPSVFATGGGLNQNPNFNSTPNSKAQLNLPAYKKNTISQVNEMNMTDFSRQNILNQRSNSNADQFSDSHSKSANIINNQHKFNSYQNDSDHKNHLDNQNYQSLQNVHINVIEEQDEEINDSRYYGQSVNNNVKDQNTQEPSHNLNDSISDFNKEFLKNLKNKNYL